jgi:hypothetical protein
MLIPEIWDTSFRLTLANKAGVVTPAFVAAIFPMAKAT